MGSGDTSRRTDRRTRTPTTLLDVPHGNLTLCGPRAKTGRTHRSPPMYASTAVDGRHPRLSLGEGVGILANGERVPYRPSSKGRDRWCEIGRSGPHLVREHLLVYVGATSHCPCGRRVWAGEFRRISSPRVDLNAMYPQHTRPRDLKVLDPICPKTVISRGVKGGEGGSVTIAKLKMATLVGAIPVVALSGCVPGGTPASSTASPPSTATSSSVPSTATPTPSATWSPDQQSAIDALNGYSATSARVGADPSKFTQAQMEAAFGKFLGPDMVEANVGSFMSLKKNGWRYEGDVAILSLKATKAIDNHDQRGLEVHVTTCRDQSAVRVSDASGKTVKGALLT